MTQLNMYAQNKNTKDQLFSFTVDNDFFLFNYTDSYYTNGFFFQLSKAKQKNNQKRITRYELGQTMFTTRERRLVWTGTEILDRQYCGYLYGRIVKDYFLKKDAVLSLKAEIGVTGDLSLAKPFQEWYHNVLGLFNYPYWDTQITNSIGANFGAKYIAPINALKNEHSLFKIITTSEANVGSYFNNLRLGSYFCIGNFEKVENSALFNNQISSTNTPNKNNKEWVFFFYPQLIYQAFNGTIQGNILKQQPESYLSEIQSIVYQHSFGFMYAQKKWAAKIEAVYQTKEATSQLQNHRYISLQAAFRF
ncbi:MAG: lipid A deacylase LpxR family protein [Chitinophagaceae bacterium]|nr:lipid A deacylase LpxR family protein [Chitinophagaceae bacterium]